MLGGIPNHEMALPNKLFEIMHAGLPMAASNVRTMAAFVREHRLGEVFDAGDPVDLARAVRTLLAEAASRPARDDALLTQYSWQGQEVGLGEAYARVATPGPAHTDQPFPALTVVWE
jgi:glycosyltransferase involved in cell wall biosynthesis